MSKLPCSVDVFMWVLNKVWAFGVFKVGLRVLRRSMEQCFSFKGFFGFRVLSGGPSTLMAKKSLEFLELKEHVDFYYGF